MISVDNHEQHFSRKKPSQKPLKAFLPLIKLYTFYYTTHIIYFFITPN